MNIKLKSEQADFCNVFKTKKQTSDMHLHCWTGEGIHKSSCRREKALPWRTARHAGDNFIPYVQNDYFILFGMHSCWISCNLNSWSYGRDRLVSFMSLLERQDHLWMLLFWVDQVGGRYKLKERQLSDPLPVELSYGILDILQLLSYKLTKPPYASILKWLEYFTAIKLVNKYLIFCVWFLYLS